MRNVNLLTLYGTLLSLLFISSTTEAASRREVVQQVLPSVVRIETQVVKPTGLGTVTGRLSKVEETGSGVILELSGKTYILTNHHIVADTDCEAVRIHLADHRILKPQKIVSTADFDVALLEITAENLTPAKIGDSDSVEVPDEILAFGNPFGLSGSVSAGIISAKNRRKIPQGNQAAPIQHFFQTDASINPGNSGGPMVNLDGEVIGVITAIASSRGVNEGVAFAIPINSVMRSARQLAGSGTVVRPYLGVELDPKFDWTAAEKAGLDRMIGARIEKVTSNSPGEKGGLLPGDIILTYNATTVEDDTHLVILIAESQVGDTLKLQIIRGQTKKIITPTLTEK
ncbi:MAG: trypsin-like peptidase domain-containing protein [Planctomycetaceae bacterium]|nr:trypsin-like peptidase domain-containing protein [Planctomycetaceae bacterium]